MKYYELELNGETIKLRLTSADSILIEKKTGVKLLDYIQDYSLTTITNLLRYMVRSSVSNFSEEDAYKLYDKLVDNGYTMAEILYDVIYEGLVVSGFLKREELDEMKAELKKDKNK